MRFGLPDEFLRVVQLFGNSNPRIEQIILYGSRATGQYRNGSDVDLALVGSHLTIDDIIQFERQLETLDVLNKFDVLLFDKISSPELKEQILTSGVELYSSTSHAIGIN
jgi:predicted nucleotidyltransferase